MSTEASNEKASPTPSGPLSWLKPKASDKLDSASSASRDNSASSDLRIATPDKDDPKPISFFRLFRSVLVSFHPVFNLYTFKSLHLFLFRFSTRTELILNGLGLIAAVAAGSAQVCDSTFLPSQCASNSLIDGCLPQPLMTLLFGNLIQAFINFTVATRNIDPNDPQSSARADEAAKSFRHAAAKDASYLTYIGV